MPCCSLWRDCWPHKIVSKPRPSMPVEVTDQSLRNGGFLAVRYGLGMFVSLGNMLVLTWWIGPHAYGTFATAVGIAAFLASLSRLGVDTYLIRCETVPRT